jgi:hypothetical protein
MNNTETDMEEELGYIDAESMAENKHLEGKASKQYSVGFFHGALFISIIAIVAVVIFHVGV